MQPPWRISVYDALLGGGPIDLPAGPTRFAYVHDGEAKLAEGGRTSTLPAGAGRFCRGAVRLSGQGTAWVYEAGPSGPLLDAPGLSLVLSRPLAPAAEGPRMVRADRMEAAPGGVTPRHFHRGPGIRRLLYGRILGEIGDAFERIDPGHAWFESGTDPVVGRNLHPGPSAFVRVLVLPPELRDGLTSFVATDAAEAAKPRAVQQHIFGEVVVDGG